MTYQEREQRWLIIPFYTISTDFANCVFNRNDAPRWSIRLIIATDIEFGLWSENQESVSYTHLDVYKRQVQSHSKIIHHRVLYTHV